MNMSAADLHQQLRARFLLPLQDVERWPREPDGEDAAAFLERLVSEGWLTPFQRERVRAGRMSELILGNHRLIAEMPQGPEGRVYQAEHVFLRDLAVIRVLRGGLLPGAGLARRLFQIGLVRRWNHPVIVGVVDSGTLPGSGPDAPALYFVSPWIEGANLDEIVSRDGPLPLESACALIYQTAHALGEAHARSLAHGSLTPSSIRRTPEGHVKLVDFCLKTWPSESFPRSPSASWVPLASEPGSLHNDLVGLARCLYRALTGADPAVGQVQSLRSLRADVPPALDELVQVFLQGNPRDAWSIQRIQETLLPCTRAVASPSEVGIQNYPATLVLPPQPSRAMVPAPPTLSEKAGRSVLIVDDEPAIRSFCRVTLARLGVHCDEAANGVLALKAFAHHDYDLVLLDIDMPEMNGLEVCRRLRAIPERPRLKIILFSGRTEADEMAPLLLTGTDDYLTKPFTPVQLQSRVQAALLLKQAQERSDLLNRELLALNRQMELHLHDRDSDLVEARNALVLGLAKLTEYRDNETGMHLNRLQHFSRRLGEEAIRHPAFAGQIDRNFIDLLACCAPLHDIGKVGLPDQVLLKPGRLTDEERRVMQMHTMIGAETLRKVAEQHGFALVFLQMSIDIARHHHERFDGTGYPDRLIGPAIPLSARIVAVADVYDAMRSRRVYKPALTHATTASHVRQGRGTHFDPNLVDCFERCEKDFDRIYEELKD